MTTAESEILVYLRAWRDAGTLTAEVAVNLISAWRRSAESGEYG